MICTKCGGLKSASGILPGQKPWGKTCTCSNLDLIDLIIKNRIKVLETSPVKKPRLVKRHGLWTVVTPSGFSGEQYWEYHREAYAFAVAKNQEYYQGRTWKKQAI